LRQAVKKGIVVKSDTIYHDVITQGSTTATKDTIEKKVFLDRVFKDTLKTETIKWKSKLIYDTINNTIYQQVECLPDTIRVPMYINNDFQKAIHSTPWWQILIGGVIIVLVLVMVIKLIK
jgi:hypothetical protein